MTLLFVVILVCQKVYDDGYAQVKICGRAGPAGVTTADVEDQILRFELSNFADQRVPCSRWLMVCCVLGSALSSALADRVFVIDPANPDRPAKAQVGRISQYDGNELVLVTRTGRSRKIRSDRIQRIETTWQAEHQQANRRLDRGMVKDALGLYRAALGKEKRRWAQREILAQSARCNRLLGQLEKAVATFLIVYQDDSLTPHMDAIPLNWQAVEPPKDFAAKCQQWLRDSNRKPIEHLIAASWMLAGSQRALAIRTLDDLTSDIDVRIAHLANCQLWRRGFVAANESTIKKWQERLQKMPTRLRFGAHYLIGLAQAKQGQSKQAALSLLRIPIHYPRNRALAAAATFSAAKQMKKAGMKGWRRLIRSVALRYPESRQASLVKAELQSARNAK